MAGSRNSTTAGHEMFRVGGLRRARGAVMPVAAVAAGKEEEEGSLTVVGPRWGRAGARPHRVLVARSAALRGRGDRGRGVLGRRLPGEQQLGLIVDLRPDL